jgi:hypothetical protein
MHLLIRSPGLPLGVLFSDTIITDTVLLQKHPLAAIESYLPVKGAAAALFVGV